MILNLEALKLKSGWDVVEPPQYPPTILDLERATGCFDMMLPLADPCPQCGAFRMRVGDWACFGHCGRCAPVEEPAP